MPRHVTPFETVIYHDGDVPLEGKIIRSKEAVADAPVILLAHAWMGLDEVVCNRAKELAEKGYTAFAIDVYGQGVRPKNAGEAAALATKYRAEPALFRSRVNAALDYAHHTLHAAPARVAAIGFCFGGSAVLELARSGAQLAGVASFHGGLATAAPATKGAIKAKIVAYHGAEDPHVPVDDVLRFQDEMRASGADWQFVSLGGALHSFTDEGANAPESGLQYNEKASKRAFGMLDVFFHELFAAGK